MRTVLALLTLACLAPAAGLSAQEVRRADWLSDARPVRVGEVITVVVDESTVASGRSENGGNTQRSVRADAAVAVGGAAVFDAPAVGSTYQRENQERTQQTRRDQFAGAVSVRVLEITEDGLLRVAGEREVVVDGTRRTLRVAGLVSPRDVGSTLTVNSTRMTDARINYSGGEPRLRAGLLGRALGWIWP
jgi:flagellar L-ring protein FlgH